MQYISFFRRTELKNNQKSAVGIVCSGEQADAYMKYERKQEIHNNRFLNYAFNAMTWTRLALRDSHVM